MSITRILAVDQIIEVQAPERANARRRAALYTTMAAAARLAKGGVINRLDAWVRATHARAAADAAHDLLPQLERWTATSAERHTLLGPVCDLLLLRVIREGGRTISLVDEVPDSVHEAVVVLVGHDVGGCVGPCETCDLGRAGDWPRVLRRVAGDSGDIVAAALADAYRAARRGGMVPPVRPVTDPDATVFAIGGAVSYGRPDPRSGYPEGMPDW